MICNSRTRVGWIAAALLTAQGAVGATPATLAQDSPANPTPRAEAKFDPKRPLSQELETSVKDGFTLGAVGDCIISRPLSHYAERDDAFAMVLKLLAQNSVMYGNMETSILDIRDFKGYPYSDGDWTLLAEPAVANDLVKMGFRMVSRANNHALDWGPEGMRETSRWLDAAGLVHAGVGENRGLARAARYFESDKGRVAIVSMVSTFRPTTAALPPMGAAPGRPGVDGLTLKKFTIVPANVMAALGGIERSFNPREEEGPSNEAEKPEKRNGPPRTLSLFENEFAVGDTPGYRYEMDKTDLAEILRSIRQGKEHADFLIATIHSHECSPCTWPSLPAAFLRDLARAAIDAGADAFITTGIHHLGPIEVYKGRPIFYGLANFFWSDIQEPLPADLYQGNRDKLEAAFQFPERATDADLANVLNVRGFANDLTFQSVIAQSRFEHGRLEEIRLYPVYLGYGMKLSESGIPRLASPEKGLEILHRLQNVSASYGTIIQIEEMPPFHNVGIIRPQSAK
jgi:poly-gamma-glutamate synthesis protein (capsule biosynthesis protein)